MGKWTGFEDQWGNDGGAKLERKMNIGDLGTDKSEEFRDCVENIAGV